MRARFITLEGIDGAGKSSHLKFIRSWLSQHQVDAVLTREPGGTALGEQLRALLLAPETKVTLETETLLMFASRQEHIAQVIAPALAAGRWVVSDRFTDASFAYQGGGRGLSFSRIAVLEDWVQQGLQPDLTLLFDVPQELAQQRMAASRELDRFELEQADFHQRVRSAYLERAANNARFCVLDSSRSLQAIQDDIEQQLTRLLETN
jgi:dTMP kinase